MSELVRVVKMADDIGRVDALCCKTLEPAWLCEKSPPTCAQAVGLSVTVRERMMTLFE